MTPRIWQVGALCRAVADALDARFNPVLVRGELSGFSRASSGHCYFSLKDDSGQIRCAMFRRAASQLDFQPRDGELVEVQGRLGVYEARGDLQLVVETLSRAGQGALFEQFLRLKARLEAEGLFDAARKRALPIMPRAIGVVTSLDAAALRDVAATLQRRVPHIPVILAPAAVQGAQAPADLLRALEALYLRSPSGGAHVGEAPPVDVILLVRGGGSLEDLWAFNDEQLARAVARSPVPVVCGVGHETDFTIADFVADLRAPTPTAAAELVSAPREVWLGGLKLIEDRLSQATWRLLDAQSQRLDLAVSRLGRPSSLVNRQQLRLASQAQRLQHGKLVQLEQLNREWQRLAAEFPRGVALRLRREHDRLERLDLRLRPLDPHAVLERGYAWLSDELDRPLTSTRALREDQAIRATLADGTVDLRVTARHPR